MFTGLPAVALALAAGAPAPVQGGPVDDIVDTAIAAGDFDTLVTALRAADLTQTLKGPGPFTVFAPTDRAFDQLPAGLLDQLLQPESKDLLTEILTFHVASGELFASDVVQATGVLSLQGQKVDFTFPGGTPLIDGAGLVTTDIVCTNGVIHVIDSVLLPAQANLAETAASAKVFNTLLVAVRAAGLGSALTGTDELTVFAPSDRAFAKLPAGTVDDLLKPENLPELIAILQNHIVAGRVYSEEVLASDKLTTIGGGELPVVVNPGDATVAGASLLALDIDASNGVIHVVDEVLLPGQ